MSARGLEGHSVSPDDAQYCALKDELPAYEAHFLPDAEKAAARCSNVSNLTQSAPN